MFQDVIFPKLCTFSDISVSNQISSDMKTAYHRALNCASLLQLL